MYSAQNIKKYKSYNNKIYDLYWYSQPANPQDWLYSLFQNYMYSK